MLRRLFTRRWLTWLLVVVVWAISCVFLGRWQWHRYESKSLSQHQVSDNYDARPTSVDSVLPGPDSGVSGQLKWRQVTLTGRYDDAHRLLVRNRPNDGYYGYELLVPFVQQHGRTVLVDRGWLENGPTAAGPAAVPPAPRGTVRVIGWLQPGEPAKTMSPVPGQVASINLPHIAQLTQSPLMTGGYVLMRSERPTSAATHRGLAPLPKPTPGTYAGINFSYALQWWAGGIGGLVFFGYRLWREEQEAVHGPRPPRCRKPKKVRIWDEEDG